MNCDICPLHSLKKEKKWNYYVKITQKPNEEKFLAVVGVDWKNFFRFSSLYTHLFAQFAYHLSIHSFFSFHLRLFIMSWHCCWRWCSKLFQCTLHHCKNHSRHGWKVFKFIFLLVVAAFFPAVQSNFSHSLYVCIFKIYVIQKRCWRVRGRKALELNWMSLWIVLREIKMEIKSST